MSLNKNLKKKLYKKLNCIKNNQNLIFERLEKRKSESQKMKDYKSFPKQNK